MYLQNIHIKRTAVTMITKSMNIMSTTMSIIRTMTTNINQVVDIKKSSMMGTKTSNMMGINIIRLMDTLTTVKTNKLKLFPTASKFWRPI